jgi:hypothetical protein
MNRDTLDALRAPKPPAAPVTLPPPPAPDWWPADKPAERLDDHHIYRANDGTWRFADGRLASRDVRRKAGVK